MQLLQHMQSQGGPQAPNQNMPAAMAAMKQSMNPPGASQPGGAPVSALQQASGAGQASGLPGATQPQLEDAALPGQNPGTTKQLLGAMSQLHQAITQMTDPQEIRMMRSIIVMLNQLIQMDQMKQNQTTGATAAQGQSQGGGMPTGQPAGAPSPTA